MFAADEMDGFDEGLHGYLENPSGAQRWTVALNRSERVVAVAFHAPEPFGDQVWNLLVLAAEPTQQRRGGEPTATPKDVNDMLATLTSLFRSNHVAETEEPDAARERRQLRANATSAQEHDEINDVFGRVVAAA